MPDLIYLNNAATSWPKAPGVAEAVARALTEPAGEPGRGGAGEDVLSACRRLIAELLGAAAPERVVFTLNATHALNIAIAGLNLGAGDLVVTSAAEHNSVLRPLERLRRERGVAVEIVELDSAGAMRHEAMMSALARRPRLVVLGHASNVTGRVVDARRYFAEARRGGARTLLDAAQTIGRVPFTAAGMEADMVAFAGHKGLLAPSGTGGLYAAPEIDIEPFLAGGTGVRSEAPRHPLEMPLRLEAGTPNLAGLAGLRAALEWMPANGTAFREREAENAALLRRRLGESAGVELHDPDERAPRTSVASFRIRGWAVEEAGYVLHGSFGVAARSGLHCAPRIHAALGSAPAGSIRFSASGFNTAEEMERAAAAVREMARCGS